MIETVIDTREFETLLNPVYIPYLYIKKRYLVLKGGADAGKSHFACQKILYRTMTEEGHRFLIIRKVKDTIRDSVFKLFCDYIYIWGLEDEFKINETSFKITFKSNGNTIIFKGCDKEEKLKSIEDITGIWIEEATELHLKDFVEINRRLRGIKHTYMQIILSYNPVLKSNWTYKRFFQNVSKKDKKKIRILTTTYKDNIFAKDDQDYIDILESYTGNNRKVYTLGQYGMLENAVYANWRMIDDKDFPDDEPIYGLDFGFIAPMALMKIVVDMEERKIYLHEEYYQTRKTINKFVADIEEKDIKEKRIIADSEAPDKIDEMIEYGYGYTEPANKNKGSVIAGIDFINQFELLITRSSTNVKREVEGYQRKQDKDGNVREEPERGVDHAMDAFRYPIYTIFYTEGMPYFYTAGKEEEKEE